MSKHTEKTWEGKNKSFPCMRHLILRLPISVWLPRSVRVWAEVLVSKRGIVSSVLCPSLLFSVIHAIQTALPSSGLLKLESERREPCKACFSFSPSCRKGLRGGRLVSAVSQKVTACVPGDTGCYHLTDEKREEKLFGKGERKDAWYNVHEYVTKVRTICRDLVLLLLKMLAFWGAWYASNYIYYIRPSISF